MLKLIVFFTSVIIGFASPAHAGWGSSRVCARNLVMTEFLNRIGAPVLFRSSQGRGWISKNDPHAVNPNPNPITKDQEQFGLAFILEYRAVGLNDYGVFISSPCPTKEVDQVTKEALTCVVVASGGATFDKPAGRYTADDAVDANIKTHFSCAEAISKVLDKVPEPITDTRALVNPPPHDIYFQRSFDGRQLKYLPPTPHAPEVK